MPHNNVSRLKGTECEWWVAKMQITALECFGRWIHIFIESTLMDSAGWRQFNNPVQQLGRSDLHSEISHIHLAHLQWAVFSISLTLSVDSRTNQLPLQIKEAIHELNLKEFRKSGLPSLQFHKLLVSLVDAFMIYFTRLRVHLLRFCFV